MRMLLFLLALVPLLALAQARPMPGSSSAVNESGVSTIGLTAPSFTATAGAGSTAFGMTTGAYLDLGSGPDDYIYSDGTIVHLAAPFDTPLGIVSGGMVTKGIQSVVMSPPVNATFTLGAGTLGAGTYCYRVTASTLAGETSPSTETCLAIGAGDAPAGINVNWGAIVGAITYKIYGRSTGAEQYMATIVNIPAATPTWLDNGSITPSGAMPTVNDSAIISAPSLVASTSMTTPTLTATAASGSDAFCAAQGAKLKLGTASLAFDGTALAASVGVSATSFTSTAASGAVAMSGINGAKFCPGAESATACFTSNGSAISATYFGVTTGMTSPLYGNLSYANPGITYRARTLDGASSVAHKFTVQTTGGLTLGSSIAEFYPDEVNPVAKIGIAGTYEMDGTDATGSPGAATINQPIMRVAVAAAASTVVVTDSIVTATTPVFCQAQAVDATCTQVVAVVPAAGSFTVTMNAACTGNTAVACLVHGMF